MYKNRSVCYGRKNLYAVPYFPKYRNLKTGGGGAVGTFSKKVWLKIETLKAI